jgi:hypothetical protein
MTQDDRSIDLKTFLLDKIESNDKRYEQRFESSSEALKKALEAADRAVNKAELANEKRFDSVNEFRATLSDQQITFVRSNEFKLMFDGLTEKIDLLQNQVISLQGRSTGKSDMMGYIVGGIGIASTIITIIFYIFKP